MRIFYLKLVNSKKFSNNLGKITGWRRYSSASIGCHHLNEKEVTPQIKHEIEAHWSRIVSKGSFNPESKLSKQYVLSMFPYPSGFLHMGHVRVYTISDTMARFYKLNGMNVIHPMGWDAFGLPAENAAIERKIPANEWTKQNIEHMRRQLMELGCAFDWDREFATCDTEYYKWTQKLFVMLFREGLAYQKKEFVNWDPVDKTVLADEQVDDNGCSWRSGAKVEKKLLRQWFVKTTYFSKALFDGLDDPILEDWKDIIKLQKHWIGDCDGYAFELKVKNQDDVVNLWAQDATDLCNASFIALSPEHVLAKSSSLSVGFTEFKVENPFTKTNLPIIVTEEVEFPEGRDSCVGVPTKNENHLKVSVKYGLNEVQNTSNSGMTSENVLKLADQLKIGGYKTSSKLKDWLISRQRFWGTPIPIIHCTNCGPVAVPDCDLPVKLPVDNQNFVGQPLSSNPEWLSTKCPSCGNEHARRETDTMDTFVDSSWYFLRFLDSNNRLEPFDKNIAKKFMPVDLYVGGKEHAVLHLYYARFFNHFLHSKGLVPHPEPFKRLLVQGMVMGQSYRLKNSGKYLPESEIEVLDLKKSKAIEKATGQAVVMNWEKMSKSKLNGVDPADVIREHGCDSIRLIMLADVAPTSHRNWSSSTFPGILFWQNRVWMTVNNFVKLRNEQFENEISNKQEFEEHNARLLDARNFYVAGTTFNYRYSHQLSVAISKMQGLTNSIRKSPPSVIIHSPEYERILASLLIMIAPMAPHFASELWSRFITAPHRKNVSTHEINWNSNVLEQVWPEVDNNHELSLTIKINCLECAVYKFQRKDLDLLKHEDILKRALLDENIFKVISNINITSTRFELYPGCHAVLHIFLDQPIKAKKDKKGKRRAAEQ